MTFFIMDSQDDHEEGDDVEEGEEDKVFLFENKPFHYMEYNDILPTEAAKFLQDFEFLEDFGNIEDNRVFEDLLESLVA